MSINTTHPVTGIYELSVTEPLRNGLLHWVFQQPNLRTVAHLYFDPPSWSISIAYNRADKEATVFRASTTGNDNILLLTGVVDRNGATVLFSASRACPVGTYLHRAGNAVQCMPCGAYEFAPRGSTSAASCKCAPGAGLVNASSATSGCAPCAGDTFRASTAANAACNACPVGTISIDGAQAPAACVVPVTVCDQITV